MIFGCYCGKSNGANFVDQFIWNIGMLAGQQVEFQQSNIHIRVWVAESACIVNMIVWFSSRCHKEQYIVSHSLMACHLQCLASPQGAPVMRIYGHGRSQMYPLFWDEVALGLWLDWTVSWDRPRALTCAVRTHLHSDHNWGQQVGGCLVASGRPICCSGSLGGGTSGYLMDGWAKSQRGNWVPCGQERSLAVWRCGQAESCSDDWLTLRLAADWWTQWCRRFERTGAVGFARAASDISYDMRSYVINVFWILIKWKQWVSKFYWF